MEKFEKLILLDILRSDVQELNYCITKDTHSREHARLSLLLSKVYSKLNRVIHKIRENG